MVKFTKELLLYFLRYLTDFLKKIGNFLFIEKIPRITTMGLIFLLVLDLLVPILPKQFSLKNKANAKIIESPIYSDSKYLNENPNFTIEFGNKNDNKDNSVYIKSRSERKNPFSSTIKQKESFDQFFINTFNNYEKGIRFDITKANLNIDQSSKDKISQGIKDLINEKDENKNLSEDEEEKVLNALLDRIADSEISNNPYNLSNGVLKEKILEGIEVQYSVLAGKGLKEDIVLSTPENSSTCFHKNILNSLNNKKENKDLLEGFDGNCFVPKNQYYFDLELDKDVKLYRTIGVTENISKPTYYFTDKFGNYLFHFAPLIAIDSKEAKTNNISLEINPVDAQNGKYEMQVTVDPNWLLSSERVFPIKIDPSVIHDTAVDFNAGNLNKTEVTADPKIQSNNKYELGDPNLIGYWHMDDLVGTTITDSSGNNLNGTATGTTIDTTSQKFGAAARNINNSSSYITVADNDRLTFLDGKYTIELWFKCNPQTFISGDDRHYILGKGTTSNYEYGIHMTSGGYIASEIWSNSGSGIGWVGYTKQKYDDSNWHNLVVSADGFRINIYVDGIHAVSGNQWSGHQNGASNLTLGRRPDGSNSLRYWVGELDEVRFLSRTLTEQEIKYNAQKRNFASYESSIIDLGSDVSSIDSLQWTEYGIKTGNGENPSVNNNLVASWNLNEGNGTTALNNAGASSCGGNAANCNGTLNNFSNTSSRDVVAGSGWTANNKRWGEGSIMTDGKDDYINAGHNNSLAIQDNITLEAWVKGNSPSMETKQVSSNSLDKLYINSQVYGDKIYYAWITVGQVYTGVSDLNGNNLVAAQRSTQSYNKFNLQMQIFNNKMYCIWEQVNSTNQYMNIFTASMNLDGSNWGYTQRTNLSVGSSGEHMRPVLFVNANKIYYAWIQYVSSYKQLVSASSNLDGSGFSATQRTSASLHNADPKIDVTNTNIYYSWINLSGSYSYIYYGRTALDGSGWTSSQLTSSTYYRDNLDFQTAGNKIYYTWNETLSGTTSLITARTNLDGTGISTLSRGSSSYQYLFTKIKIIGDKINYVYVIDSEVYLSWHDIDNSNWTTTNLSYFSGFISNVDIQIVGAKQYYFCQKSDGSYNQIYMIWDGANIVSKGDVYGLGVNSSGFVGFVNTGINASGISNQAGALIQGPVINGWAYLAITYDRNNLKLYINGKLIESYSYTEQLSTAALDLLMGQSFYGVVDSVRLHNAALTENQILSNSQVADIDFLTRTGPENDPYDGGWENWSPSNNETQISSLDSENAAWIAGGNTSSNVAEKLAITNSGITLPSAPTGCQNYKIININNLNNSNSLTDYQIHFSTRFIEGMGSNFSNLRFTNTSGTDLNYWLQDGDLSSQATVWVKVDSIPANSSTNIIMWYGNCSGGLSENGNNTFQAFQGFDTDGSFPSIGGGGGNYTVSNGILTMNETSSGTNLSYALNVINSFTSNGNGSQVLMAKMRPAVLKELQGVYMFSTSESRFYKFCGTQSWGVASDMPHSGNMADFETVYTVLNDFSGTGYIAPMIDDDATASSVSMWDWIMVRKYTPVEPIAQILYSNNAKMEGNGALRLQQGKAMVDVNTTAIWHLDETSGNTAYDDSLNMISGTYNGTTSNNGIFNSSRSFNGSTDYIDLGNNSALRSMTKNQTIDMWLYPTDFSTRQNPFAKAFGGEGTITQETSGHLNYYYGTNGGNNSPYQSFMTTTPLKLNSWNHICLVRDLTNMRLYWYINGRLDNHAVASYATATASSLNAYIGKGYVNNYAGRIDEVRLLRRALSADEVYQSYKMAEQKTITKTIASQDLTAKTKIPIWIASDKPGNYIQASISEGSYANNEKDDNTKAIFHLDENDNNFNDSFVGTNFISNNWVEIDTNNKLAQSSGIVFSAGSTAAWNAAIVSQRVYPRQKGNVLYASFTTGSSVAAPNHMMIGWAKNNTTVASHTNITHALYFNAGGFYVYQDGKRKGGSYGAYTTSTTYEIRITLAGTTAKYEVKGGAYTNWTTLLAADNAKTNNDLRVQVSQYQHTGTLNFVRVFPAQNIIESTQSSNITLTYGSRSSQGVAGKGKYFDGVNDYIRCFNSYSDTNNFTMEFWVKPESTRSETIEATTGIYGTSGQRYAIFPANGDSKYGAGHSGAGVSVGTNGISVFEHASNYLPALLVYNGSISGWNHIAVVYQNKQPKLYLNGMLVKVGQTSSKIVHPSCDMGESASQYGYYQGYLDEFKISNTAKTDSEIKQSYDLNNRYQDITIEFAAKPDMVSTITNSSTSIQIDATSFGLAQKAQNLVQGDKLIIKQNVDGIEYLAQGTVSSVNSTTGAVGIYSWDSGSTFPSAGFDNNAQVFKWQKEYIDISNIMTGSGTGDALNQKDAITKLTFKLTNNAEGRDIFIDDMRVSEPYLSDPTATGNVTSSIQRYFQYKALFNSSNSEVTPAIGSVTTNSSNGPTNDLLMRHGQFFSNGIKQSYWWAK